VNWRYVLTPRAERDFERVPMAMRRRLFAALEQLAADPQRGDVRKLHGRGNEWRLRVGDWRVTFEYDDAAQVIVVLRVVPRGRAYRN
jgi:mRNA interferase RelE/StbE